MTMTHSRDHYLSLLVPENSATSMTIEPNDAGGPPVLVFTREDGDLEVFNWEAQAYQPVEWLGVP